MIWTKNQERVINSHVSVYSDSGKCFYCWAPKEFDPRQFSDELKESGETDCYFSISLMRANIFFKAKYLGFDHAGLQFGLPEKVFKVQRRKDLRFPIPDGHVLKIDFSDPLSPDKLINKKCVDLSASGMAFLIEEEEVPLYPVGLMLENMTFTVRNRQISTAAEIRNTRPTRAEARKKGIVVGVVFKNLKAADNQHIAAYVFEESRKYFSKFI